MLLIDPGRTVASLPADAVPVPCLMRSFRGDPVAAKVFLERSGSLERLIPLLVKEIGELGVVRRIAASLPMAILAEAARAIAHGSILVGLPVADTVTLVFQESASIGRRSHDMVRFARQAVAVNFLTGLLANPSARAAIETVLGQPRAVRLAPPADPIARIDWLAGMLITRQLGLFPVHGESSGLRIAWISHQTPSKIQPADPSSASGPAPPPPPPPAQAVQSAASPLPDLPAEVSPQAQTLMDAAQSGVPFCEECAKAAAAQAGV